MTIKEQLDQIIELHKSINRKLAQKRTLQDMATGTGATLSDLPRKKEPGDRVGHLVQRMVDLEAEADADIDRLADMKEEANPSPLPPFRLKAAQENAFFTQERYPHSGAIPPAQARK